MYHYEKKKFLSMYLLKSQIIYYWNLICIMYHPNTTNTYNRLIITFNLKEIQLNSLYNEIEDSFKIFDIQEFDREIFFIKHAIFFEDIVQCNKFQQLIIKMSAL